MNKAILAFALTVGFSASAMAAEFTGTIIDEKCSTVASMKGDVDCATKCIKGGSPAVLLTDAGKIYKIADQAKVVPMAGKKVTISGTAKGDTLTVASIK
ncbi:MAG: hypothetical protein LAP40_14605 [Acidobacteriia bacterium]|nr:hypothetical protein [Terriglobia bacterium]